MPDLLGTQTRSVLPLLSQWQLESSAQGAQALLSCCQAALERSVGSRDTSSPVDPCEVNTLLYRTCYPKTAWWLHSTHLTQRLLSASTFIISQMNLACLILVVFGIISHHTSLHSVLSALKDVHLNLLFATKYDNHSFCQKSYLIYCYCWYINVGYDYILRGNIKISLVTIALFQYFTCVEFTQALISFYNKIVILILIF